MSRSQESMEGGRLLKLVQAIAIEPQEAKKVAQKYRAKALTKDKTLEGLALKEATAELIIGHYAQMSALSGGTSGLTGLIPGLGTVVAAVGGSVTDMAVTMKLQVNMCMCMIAAFEHDMDSEDAAHLAFLLAAGGTLEQAGEKAAVKLASEAGVKMLRQYLKGAALQAIKEFFKKIGIVFTRKALEKALPFGVGVVLGGSFNYVLTRYVGKMAKGWLAIDAQLHE